jgi:DNA polymerase III subunit delta'
MPFRDLAGHRRLIDLLSRSVARKALPSSLIFAGPSTTGKRAATVAVAQALNCPSSPEAAAERADACGRCSACTRIARNVYPDVLIVEPGDSGAIKIDRVRDVIDRTAYRPFEGRRRVVIFDEADALVVPAQNALLKTLEEPPPSSVFILLTARPETLLPTVRSRCIRLAFADADLQSDTSPEARGVAQRVLAHAAGSDNAVKRLDGAKELLAKIGSSRTGDRELMADYLRAIGSLLRDVAAVACGADEAVLANRDARPLLERLAVSYRGERGVQAFTAIDKALAALKANAGVKVLADWVMVQL